MTRCHSLMYSSHRINQNDLKCGWGMLKAFVIKSFQKLLLSIKGSGHFEQMKLFFAGQAISEISPDLPQLTRMSKITLSDIDLSSGWGLLAV